MYAYTYTKSKMLYPRYRFLANRQLLDAGVTSPLFVVVDNDSVWGLLVCVGFGLLAFHHV